MAKNPVQIMETVLRDGHQSLCATRMRIEDMLPQLEALDAVGYKALEAWGGATFDTCLRFLGEDPWERLDTLKANLNTPIQMLLRGQNLLGYNHYSNDVVEKFVQKASEHGVGVFRIFDALNDVRNLKVAINAALHCPEKPEVQGCLVYTISPVHTNEKFVELAKELQDMGCHSICIKDMSGLLKPYVAEDLVKKLKAALDIPVELHTHCTSGFGHATYLKAIEAGVDIIDTALAPFSSDTSQPCTETMVRALEGTEYDTGIDVQKLTPISKHFLSVKKRIIEEFNLKGYFDINPNVLDFQIPGGMLSNLANQLKEAGMEDKYQELLDEMPRVRKDLGYPPLVTPSSQIVGTMATFNVMSGQRYKMVPKEFKDLARGKFGRTPVAVDRDFLTKTLGIAPEDIIEDCSVEDAKAKTFAEFEAELKEKGYLNPSEEDVLSYALFPQVAEEFFQNHYQKITAYKKA
ncbi:MAG: pyruvate carboxylase subunit B [Selenomonas sp.]|uniref:pyruvate carboxylase subunit B n=1 Tax=Selenomonas sp. TaxID=2053611 RepID=UPI0025F44877|nr:pyruvate carboxylase subunit B [Selenomonas sp.]MCR5439644.1 pyruvate carboxylase subunit B [Selenomonas sp.]